jgi:hypothetical protein
MREHLKSAEPTEGSRVHFVLFPTLISKVSKFERMIKKTPFCAQYAAVGTVGL